MKKDIYQEVTNRIIEGLKDPGKWQKPWQSMGTELPHNATSGRPYSGINVLLLAIAGDYPTQQWLTFKQAQACGGSVRKGEKGTAIIFWKKIEKKELQGDKEIDKSFAMLKTFTVFNVAQCDGLDENKITKYVPPVAATEGVIEIAKSLGANVQYGGDRACFIPSMDLIQMPSEEAFKDKANHEATLLHELVHWTGSKVRLDRIAHHSYAEEELVAELGAAMAGAVLGVPYEGLMHVEYIASWLKALENDKKHIFKAAKLAQKAVDFITAGIEPVELDQAA